MDVASLIALAEAGATIMQKVQAARAALSETDQGALDAKLTQIRAGMEADYARVDGELAAAG